MIMFVTWKILVCVVGVCALFENLHFICEQQHLLGEGSPEKVSSPSHL